MLAILIRVTLIFAIFVNYANCETNQEFRDMILQKVADQDEKIQKQEKLRLYYSQQSCLIRIPYLIKPMQQQSKYWMGKIQCVWKSLHLLVTMRMLLIH